MKYSEREWQTRIDLAAAIRLGVGKWGDDLLFEHASARNPDQADQYLMNDPALLLEEITASNLHLLDAQGNEVRRADAQTHRFSFPMHKSVYDAIPEANCVLHCHSIAVAAVSMQKQGLVRNSQWALWMGNVSYHEYEGFLTGPSEAKKLVECFQKAQVTLLRSHGLIVWGHSVRETFILAYLMNQACLAQAASGIGQGIPGYEVSDEIVHRVATEAKGPWSDEFDFNKVAWAALLRKAKRDHPNFDE